VHDNSCEIQEQRFVAQFVLHPQQMSNIRASDVGCWFIQLTDNIFFSITHPCFSADGRPNIKLLTGNLLSVCVFTTRLF
jgi:hypothetical protein